jgi:hypothetical protein
MCFAADYIHIAKREESQQDRQLLHRTLHPAKGWNLEDKKVVTVELVTRVGSCYTAHSIRRVGTLKIKIVTVELVTDRRIQYPWILGHKKEIQILRPQHNMTSTSA